MINKFTCQLKHQLKHQLKYLFLLVICLGAFGSVVRVSAQSNVQRQSDRLIGYYEWLFETSFTGDERSRYYEIKTEDFQTDGAGEQKGIDSLMDKFSTIKSKNENEQERIRGGIVPNFVKSLQDAGSDNKEAKFLLAIYENAQTKAEREAEANGVGDISAYVGKWAWSHTGTSTVIGGVYAGSNGSRYTYEFASNGDVQFTGILNIMQGGCNQQVFQSRRGKAHVSGNNLTISWEPEKFTRDFSCDAANNYTKTMPAKVEKMKISFKTDLGQKQMCIIGAECFSEAR